MDMSNKNILDVYKKYEQSEYILNNFLDSSPFGLYGPHTKTLFENTNSKDFSGIRIVDKNNKYFVNDLGFRGKIKNNPEIIALGCSYTFGVGIPENGTWPSILSDQIGVDILNLGVPGNTIKKTCELAIRYMSKFEKPKTVFALFPGFFRNMLIEDTNFYTSANSINQKEERGVITQRSFQARINYDRDKNFMSFEKVNTNNFFNSKDKNVRYMENVLSPHQLISDSIDSISTLQDFCYSHGIEFYWSTWDIPTTILMDTLLKIPNFKLKNYIKFADDEFDNYSGTNNKFPDIFCNSNHGSELSNHPSWNCGSDVWIDKEGKVLESFPSHPGIHFQHHIADIFKNF